MQCQQRTAKGLTSALLPYLPSNVCPSLLLLFVIATCGVHFAISSFYC